MLLYAELLLHVSSYLTSQLSNQPDRLSLKLELEIPSLAHCQIHSTNVADLLVLPFENLMVQSMRQDCLYCQLTKIHHHLFPHHKIPGDSKKILRKLSFYVFLLQRPTARTHATTQAKRNNLFCIVLSICSYITKNATIFCEAFSTISRLFKKQQIVTASRLNAPCKLNILLITLIRGRRSNE